MDDDDVGGGGVDSSAIDDDSLMGEDAEISIFGQTTGASNATWVECDRCKKVRIVSKIAFLTSFIKVKCQVAHLTMSIPIHSGGAYAESLMHGNFLPNGTAP
jgi:hypothetical protein